MGEINELQSDGLIVLDSREFEDNGILLSESMRIITENEFNVRFNTK